MVVGPLHGLGSAALYKLWYYSTKKFLIFQSCCCCL